MLAGTAVTVNAVLRGSGRFAASAISSARFRRRRKSVQAFEEESFAKVRPTSLLKGFSTSKAIASLVTYDRVGHDRRRCAWAAADQMRVLVS